MGEAFEPVLATPRVILCDLDDTILNDSAGAEDAWREVCAEAARRVAGLDAGALFAAISEKRTWYWSDPERHRVGRQDLRAASQEIVAMALSDLGHDLPSLAWEIAHGYRDRRDAAIRPFPGAFEALESLRARGIRLALITNGSRSAQYAKIERFGLAPYFDHIIVEGEFGVGKPDPRVYHAAMSALASQPAETWCVGDNLEWEVAAPQRLGVTGIWVDHARRGLPEDAGIVPDRIINAITELPPLIG